jgi:two-component system, OmpR family, response regulator
VTVKRLARQTKLSTSLLSQIERAEVSPSISDLFKIARALNLRLTRPFAGY